MTKQVYFASAIKGDTSFASANSLILEALEEMNAPDHPLEILSELAPGFRERTVAERSPSLIFNRDHREWLEPSQAVVAEISGESFGVGWEIAYAQEVLGIPVLCLLNKAARLPAFVRGNTHQGLYIKVYEDDDDQDIFAAIRSFVESRVREKSPGTPSGVSSPSDTRHPSKEPHDWCEGRLASRRYSLNVCALLPGKEQAIRDRLTGALAASCHPRKITITETIDPVSSFKMATTRLRSVRRAVLIGDATKASTDLGWFTCFSQWNHCQVILPFKSGTDLSWMALGQTPGPLTIRAPAQKQLWSWTPRYRVDLRRRERPRVCTLPFSSESELRERLRIALMEISRAYYSFELPERIQARVADYESGLIPHSETWTRDFTLRFIVEALVRHSMWGVVTAEGIGGTFLSGERSELIALLKYHDLASSPSSLYVNLRYALNYEEKAFAKNVRAFKDVGILLKTPLPRRRRTLTPRTSLHQWVDLPPQQRQATMDEVDGNPVRRPLVVEAIILTDFGRHLSEYVDGGRMRTEALWNLLKASPVGIPRTFAEALGETVNGRMEYLLEELPKDMQAQLVAVADRFLQKATLP